MPILALDQFGNIHESDRDRSDGKGFNRSPSAVARRDNTLDNSHLISEHQQEADVAYNRAADAVTDAFDRRVSRARAGERQAQAARNARDEDTVNSQSYRELMTKRAMGTHDDHCQCTTMMSGHGLTANGQKGYAGMSRDDRAIHKHLNGLGAAPAAYQQDELAQQALQSQANVDLYFQAQKEALRVAAEAQMDSKTKPRAVASGRPMHPLLAMFAARGFR
jgi:hypothetical protein